MAIGVYEAEGLTGLDPPIPWGITCTLDYAWVASQIALSSLLPPEPPLRVRREVLRPNEHHEFTRQEAASLATCTGAACSRVAPLGQIKIL